MKCKGVSLTVLEFYIFEEENGVFLSLKYLNIFEKDNSKNRPTQKNIWFAMAIKLN